MINKTSILYKMLPQEIKTTLLISEGWLVGSSVDNTINNISVNDYDIIVTDINKFGIITKTLESLSDSFKLNNYGGIKFSLKSGHIIDIWVEELAHFIMSANKFTYAFNIKRAILLQKEGG